MFAVTGATGQLGQRVIAHLVESVPPEQIVAIVRDPAKAAGLLPAGVIIRQAAYDEPAQLSAALQGVTRLLLISSSEIGQRVGQHGNVISAAAAAGVGFLLYTSLLHADGSTIGLAGEHRATEALIAQSGLPYAILRNGWYLENYLAGADPALQHGAMIGSGGEGRISAATRDDYAEAAARLLNNPPAPGSVLELAGDEAFTEAEFAAALAAAAGKPVHYVPLDEADHAGALQGAGLPPPVAAMIANSSAAVAGGALFDDSRTLSRVLGRPTASWRTVVTAAFAA